LGYGEDDLLTRARTDRRNVGTSDFWKVFSSCVAENEDDLGFDKILKTRTRSFTVRLHNKVNVLQEMREKGIWLLDASIIGLYGSDLKAYPDLCDTIVRISWDNHLARIIENAQPSHVIVIGKGVEKALRLRLQKLKISRTVIDAPQAHLISEEQLENYKKYQRICAKYH